MIWNAEDHSNWGDSILVFNWKRRRFTGHTTPRVREGDDIRMKMKSGKTGRFLVKSVEYPGDPHDQWFADAEDAGYVEE